MVKVMRRDLYYSTCSLLLICRYIDANKIKLQIETDDLMKLMDGIMKTDLIKNFVAQIIPRSESKTGIYNNPYHPEDDFANHESTQEKNKQDESGNFKPYSERNSTYESKIEMENDNFILGQDEKYEENITSLNNFSVENDNMKTEIDLPKEISRKHSSREMLDDTHNFKRMQKRFILKKSQNV